MNKKLTLIFVVFLVVSSFSNATYIIKKAPTERTDNYKITYTIENEKGLLEEIGFLTESIKKYDCADNPLIAFRIYYRYSQHKNIDQQRQLNKFENNLFCNDNFQIIECTECHPIIFYLHNIRSGLCGNFSGRGSQWTTKLANNEFTYLNSPASLEAKTMNVKYIVQNIEDYEPTKKHNDPSETVTIDEEEFKMINNEENFTQKYTITWNALRTLNRYSRRKGEIQVDSEGTIHFLHIYNPQQLSGFSIGHQSLKQPTKLSIERISK